MNPYDQPTARLDLRYSLPEWHLHAACRGMDPQLFFPDKGNSTKKALAACAICPVRQECLDDALSHAEVDARGVWGGTVTRQRRAMRRGTQYQRREAKPHVPNPCKVCGDPVKALDLCNRHYQRFRRYGDPTAGPGAGAPRRIDLDRLVELGHLTSIEAAPLLGVSKQTVSYWRRRLADNPGRGRSGVRQ